MLLVLVWVIKHIGHNSTKTFGGTKIVFLYNFHLHLISHYIAITCNFEDHYILQIQYQFTIIVSEILPNIIQNKIINWLNSIS